MKNSKKTWGMLGTSMGSMLIIVALLTMVGMGSSDTYAATDGTRVCTCKKNGTLNQAAETCTYYEEEEYECNYGTDNAKCSTYTGAMICKCTRSVPKTEAASCQTIEPDDRYDPNEVLPECPSGTHLKGKKCVEECPSGTHLNGDKCVADATDVDDDRYTCKLNEYRSGNTCSACPNNASCDGGTSFTCNDGYKQSGNTCIPEDPPKDPTDYEKSECDTVNEPCKIHGRTGICTLTGGKKLCQITTSPSGGDDDDDKPSNPNKPTGGDDDDKPNNPNKPTGGGDGGSGGNGGGNSGGNGNGGNTGGNNGNNNGGNNATKNPNTATKAPLVIAIIGIISVGISSVVYFKGKKEINTEI